MPALRNLRTLERVTGVSGEIDVTVARRQRGHAGDRRMDDQVREPAAGALRLSRDARLLGARRCARRCRCRTCSRRGGQPGKTASLSQTQINQLLGAVPTYFSQAVITPDHRQATLAFGIRLMPLSRQQRVIDYMRSQLHPPPGSARSWPDCRCSPRRPTPPCPRRSDRLLTLLAGLVAVGLVLLLVFRDLRPGAGADDPDRAGHRLVGADPVPDRDPAEPDVGDAGDAGDRDLDRVQRAAVRALPPGARRRPRPARGAGAHLPLDRRGGARLRDHRDRRASGCWSSPTSRCCATSGSSRWSTCRCRSAACCWCCPPCWRRSSAATRSDGCARRAGVASERLARLRRRPRVA